ncbi:MAG: hypothetical protein IKL79_02185 [Clostridia bacterium]|nr:hypothetical protein [Clostridia bacterium]MBR3680796.1 hypothetical protein [Clostridia bacterium]
MLKKILKYILYFTLITATAVPVLTFTSCDRKYDEGEVITAATELLKKSETLNVILFGEGLATGGTNQSGAYKEADFYQLNSLGFTTVVELEGKIREVFTVEYSDYAISTVLSPIQIDGAMVSNSRYYQLYADEVNKIDPVCIMVHTQYDYIFTDKVVYDYETVRVKDVKRKTLFISVMATVTNKEGQSQSTEVVFELIEESDGWRINTGTFVNYNAYRDRYEELKDQDLK